MHVLFSICNSCILPLCPVLHHYTEQKGNTNFWAKSTLLGVQICFHCRGNSSQAASFTLPTTHIDKYTKIQTAQRKCEKGADQSTATCSACLHVQYSVWLRPTITWKTLCASGGKEKETYSDLLPQEYTDAETVQFYTSIKSNWFRPRQKTALYNGDKRCLHWKS